MPNALNPKNFISKKKTSTTKTLPRSSTSYHILEAAHPIRNMKIEALEGRPFDSSQSDKLHYSHCHSPAPKYEVMITGISRTKTNTLHSWKLCCSNIKIPIRCLYEQNTDHQVFFEQIKQTLAVGTVDTCIMHVLQLMEPRFLHTNIFILCSYIFYYQLV